MAAYRASASLKSQVGTQHLASFGTGHMSGWEDLYKIKTRGWGKFALAMVASGFLFPLYRI